MNLSKIISIVVITIDIILLKFIETLFHIICNFKTKKCEHTKTNILVVSHILLLRSGKNIIYGVIY